MVVVESCCEDHQQALVNWSKLTARWLELNTGKYDRRIAAVIVAKSKGVNTYATNKCLLFSLINLCVTIIKQNVPLNVRHIV